MVSVASASRVSAGVRRAPFSWVVLGVTACSGMLDLPDDPYLAQPATVDGGQSASAMPGSGSAPVPSVSGVDTEPGSEGGAGNVPGTPRDNAPVTSAGEGDVQPPLERSDAGAATPPPDAAPALACPGDATLGPGDRCYATVTTSLTWPEARSECQALGAGWDLVAIRSAEENELVTELASGEAWLGGSDAAEEGEWLWVDDEALFWSGDGTTGAAVDGAFETWNSDEPNGGGPSDCLRLVPELGTWADLQCSFERPAVCEGPVR